MIHVTLIDEASTPAPQRQIVGKLIDALVSARKENFVRVLGVTIEEICNGEWSIGGPARDQVVHTVHAGSNQK
jgi:phenylpyruvate tautomerase PptA (4-oxalocrotonate tautomerase family)